MEPNVSFRILVTGGSGFIGTNLVEHCLRAGTTVLNLDLAAPRAAGHGRCWRKADILDCPSLKAHFAAFDPTHVVHLAARTDIDGTTVEQYAANTQGVRNLVEAAAGAASLKRVIFASTRLVCKIGYQPRSDTDYCPTTAYGASKVEGEKLVRQLCAGAAYGSLILRPTSIWGPWFGVPYRNFFDAVRLGRYLHPRGLRIHKSFGYVGNSVYQLDRLMFAPDAQVQGRTLYLCDYAPVEVRAWAETVRAAFGAPPVREVPVPLLRAGAAAGDALKALGMRNPPLTSFRLANLMTEMLHETAPLEAACGPLPHSLDEGVRRTVAWMENPGAAAQA